MRDSSCGIISRLYITIKCERHKTNALGLDFVDECFIYFGLVLSAMGFLTLPDHHAAISLLFGIAALSCFVVSYFLYRKPKPISPS